MRRKKAAMVTEKRKEMGRKKAVIAVQKSKELRRNRVGIIRFK